MFSIIAESNKQKSKHQVSYLTCDHFKVQHQAMQACTAHVRSLGILHKKKDPKKSKFYKKSFRHFIVKHITLNLCSLLLPLPG